jgi:fluoroacetyl-CoA thioesterase
MLPTLVPGLTHTLTFKVTRDKTVPFIIPENPLAAAMPEVLASGFMLGLMEWCCIELLVPHLEPGEGSLGTMFDMTHEAATPAGMTVTVEATLERVEGRQLAFRFIARDDADIVSRGRHGRTVVRWDRFLERLAKKGVVGAG